MVPRPDSDRPEHAQEDDRRARAEIADRSVALGNDRHGAGWHRSTRNGLSAINAVLAPTNQASAFRRAGPTARRLPSEVAPPVAPYGPCAGKKNGDRKSTRLNSSH